MMLTKEDFEYLAALARLEVSEQDRQTYADQLAGVFSYFETLQEVDTADTTETCQVTGLEDVTREDVVKDCDEEIKQRIIDNFPEKVGKLLKVRGVFT